MVRHPKKKKPIKKSEPTDSENKDTPPTEPVIGEEEKSGAKGILDRLFWIRVIMAVIGGLMATVLLEPIEGEERRWASIALMIVIFIISIGVWKSLYKDSLRRLPTTAIGKKKLVTTGIGSFIFLYLFVWILSYTIVNSTNSGLLSSFP